LTPGTILAALALKVHGFRFGPTSRRSIARQPRLVSSLNRKNTGKTALKTRLISFAALGAAFFAGAATVLVSGCGSGSSGGTVLAVVNGETITMDEFHKYLEAKPTVRVQTNSGVAEARVAESLAFQGLQDMIARQVTLQLAADEKVYPSEADINKELDFQKKLNPNFLPQLTRSGLTIERIKQSLLLNLARERLITKGVTVTMKEAEDYIAADPKQFVEPATVDMLWIFVRSESNKAQVDSALSAGQTFSIVATQFSEFPGARQQNGRFPQRQLDQLPADIQKLVNSTNEGRATAWIKMQDGWAKFFVEKKTAEKPMDMTPEKKELVRRQLAQQRGGQAIDLGKRVLDKLVESKVEVKERSLIEAWNTAFERFKEEQKVEVPTAESAKG
jgi:parvulin-like peptidyl-prolyl isomerase